MLVNKKFIRFLFIVLCVLILFLIVRHYSDASTLSGKDEFILRPSDAPVYVMVFYEALCPDSKNFIVRQLQPTYQRAPQLIEIQFVPYGKASTFTNNDGSLRFECQHGPTECQANIIHACSIEAIHDSTIRLNFISCMIRDNMIPKDAFHRCAKEYSIDIESIQKCYDSPHGSELLKIHGEATNALRPKVSFIPTVTLDGSQGRQASILKDLFKEVCKVAAGRGPMPEICE
uniref:Putative gamma-interferon inducible lysosomal thiol reductase n=1 Tax=Corethrella appendiculata TaxID=1370023 RepID=U5ERN9_9DIPT